MMQQSLPEKGISYKDIFRYNWEVEKVPNSPADLAETVRRSASLISSTPEEALSLLTSHPDFKPKWIGDYARWSSMRELARAGLAGAAVKNWNTYDIKRPYVYPDTGWEAFFWAGESPTSRLAAMLQFGDSWLGKMNQVRPEELPFCERLFMDMISDARRIRDETPGLKDFATTLRDASKRWNWPKMDFVITGAGSNLEIQQTYFRLNLPTDNSLTYPPNEKIFDDACIKAQLGDSVRTARPKARYILTALSRIAMAGHPLNRAYFELRRQPGAMAQKQWGPPTDIGQGYRQGESNYR